MCGTRNYFALLARLQYKIFGEDENITVAACRCSGAAAKSGLPEITNVLRFPILFVISIPLPLSWGVMKVQGSLELSRTHEVNSDT